MAAILKDEEEVSICPLCVEEIDVADRNFLPCPCGYQVCMWCWHHIRENLNGLCPGCRAPYSADPHAFSAVEKQETLKKNRDKKQKDKLEKKFLEKEKQSSNTTTNRLLSVDRKHLHNYRVVQRNLVYIIGLPSSCSSEDTLRRAEYFGQYGKISKVVIHRNGGTMQGSVSAYITFVHKDDAKACITALDGFWLEGHPLRASFGTTKYCNNFIRSVPCTNPECVYLHDLGDDDDRFTKEEIQAGHTKLVPAPGRDQTVVTGNGGPSGTGKRPQSEPFLPAPVFLQDMSKPSLIRSASTASVRDGNPSPESVPAPAPPQESFVATESTTMVENSVESKEPFETSEATRDDKPNGQYLHSYFNGLSRNAVFPVPSSSLSYSVWSAVLETSSADLHLNPFAHQLVSFTDLLDLTLPPVDYLTSQRLRLVESSASGAPYASAPALPQLHQIFPGAKLAFVPRVSPSPSVTVPLVPRG